MQAELPARSNLCARPTASAWSVGSLLTAAATFAQRVYFINKEKRCFLSSYQDIPVKLSSNDTVKKRRKPWPDCCSGRDASVSLHCSFSVSHARSAPSVILLSSTPAPPAFCLPLSLYGSSTHRFYCKLLKCKALFSRRKLSSLSCLCLFVSCHLFLSSASL
jgi:hypothetical protein